MELEEIFDDLERLYQQADIMKGLAYLLWSSLFYDKDSDNAFRAITAFHLYYIIEEFNYSFQQDIRAMCPIARIPKDEGFI